MWNLTGMAILLKWGILLEWQNYWNGNLMAFDLGQVEVGQEENGELNSSQSDDVINSLANRKSMTS